MINFFSLSKEAVTDKVKVDGFPGFRASQLLDWVYKKNVIDLERMTNLNTGFRDYLKHEFSFRSLTIITRKIDQKGETVKYLLSLEDGNTLEMVIMRYLNRDQSKERNTLCLSSQVGCPVGCPFCATGQSGLVRNLKTEEIVEQVILANEYLGTLGERVNNVVFMGMGEPFLNRNNVFPAADLIKNNFNISSRRITLSTSGVVEGIRAMADLEMKYVLAVSLHGARDDLRNTLVPLNTKYNLEELMRACRYYQNSTNKRITFEYIIIDGINMSDQDARELGRLLKGIDCHINGIPINAVPGSRFKRPSRNKVYHFKALCEAQGLSFSIREEKGLDVEGACGQLRNQERI